MDKLVWLFASLDLLLSKRQVLTRWLTEPCLLLKLATILARSGVQPELLIHWSQLRLFQLALLITKHWQTPGPSA